MDFCSDVTKSDFRQKCVFGTKLHKNAYLSNFWLWMTSFVRLNIKMAEFASLQCVSSLLNLSRAEILIFGLIFDQMDLQTKNSDMSDNVWHWKLKKSDIWVNSDNLSPAEPLPGTTSVLWPSKTEWGWGGAYPICGRILGLRWGYLRLRWGGRLSETSKNTTPPRAPKGTKKKPKQKADPKKGPL